MRSGGKSEEKNAPGMTRGSNGKKGYVTMPGKRKTWDPRKMKGAIVAVRSGEMGYLLASKTFGVPK
ncbi:hypothetical protein C0J52_25087 [Blattella germanica]|nr:hypothetical protein C0J52_25087 [Blattella germanica]